MKPVSCLPLVAQSEYFLHLYLFQITIGSLEYIEFVIVATTSAVYGRGGIAGNLAKRHAGSGGTT